MRSHLYKPIQDAQGNLRSGAVVRVFNDGTSSLTDVPLFVGPNGAGTKAPIHNAPNGIVEFFTEQPQRFRIGIKVGDEPEVLFDAVDVLEPSYPSDTSLPGSGSGASAGDSGPVTNATTTNTTSGAITVPGQSGVVFADVPNGTATLPSPAGIAGRQYVFKNFNDSPLTIVANGGLIDADNQRVLAQFDALTIISNGTNWGVV